MMIPPGAMQLVMIALWHSQLLWQPGFTMLRAAPIPWRSNKLASFPDACMVYLAKCFMDLHPSRP